MERKSVLRSVTGAITCAAAGPRRSSLFKGRGASLPVVSRAQWAGWRRTEAAWDGTGEAV